MSEEDVVDQPSYFQRLFFLKTTFARLLLAIILVGGWLAYGGMIKESNPDLEIAAAVVTTTWAGGDSQTIEQEITNKLERRLQSLSSTLYKMRRGSRDIAAVL